MKKTVSSYKVHYKSKAHKRLENYSDKILPVGGGALCRSFRVAQTLTDDIRQITCERCKGKLGIN